MTEGDVTYTTLKFSNVVTGQHITYRNWLIYVASNDCGELRVELCTKDTQWECVPCGGYKYGSRHWTGVVKCISEDREHEGIIPPPTEITVDPMPLAGLPEFQTPLPGVEHDQVFDYGSIPFTDQELEPSPQPGGAGIPLVRPYTLIVPQPTVLIPPFVYAPSGREGEYESLKVEQGVLYANSWVAWDKYKADYEAENPNRTLSVVKRHTNSTIPILWYDTSFAYDQSGLPYGQFDVRETIRE